jgi:ATP-dependent exoDNAse (exonuclease V) beta subunit
MRDTDTNRLIDAARDILVGKVTLSDFKPDRVGHLADKYRRQMIRYRTIIQSIFPGRTIEGYLLFVDEPHRVLTVL